MNSTVGTHYARPRVIAHAGGSDVVPPIGAIAQDFRLEFGGIVGKRADA